MIKLTDLNSLKQLSKKRNVPKTFKCYLNDYVNEMLSRFKTESLENFGSIFVLENLDDILNYEKMGFNDPIEVSEADYSLNVALIDKGTTLSLVQLVYFKNNYATIIFTLDDILKEYSKNQNMEVIIK